MATGCARRFSRRSAATLVGLAILLAAGYAQSPAPAYKPDIPRTWDEQALSDLEVPLAVSSQSPKHISVEEYYRLPVRPIYKSYPFYRSDREPAGYADWLRQQEPVIFWDDTGH